MGKTATLVVFYGKFETIWRKKIVAFFAYPRIGNVYAKKNMIVGWMIFLYETRHKNNEYFKSALPIYFRKIYQENQTLFIRWSEKYSINFYHALLTWFVIFTFFRLTLIKVSRRDPHDVIAEIHSISVCLLSKGFLTDLFHSFGNNFTDIWIDLKNRHTDWYIRYIYNISKPMTMKLHFTFSDFVFPLWSESDFEITFYTQLGKIENYGNKPGTAQIVTTEKNPHKIRDPLMFRKIFLSEKSKQYQQCHYFGPTKLLWTSFAGIINFYTSKKGVTAVCQEKLYCTPKNFTVNLWRFKNGAFWKISR